MATSLDYSKNTGAEFLSLLVMACCALLFSVLAHAEESWLLNRPASSFNRYFLTNPADLQKVKDGNTLAGVTGWFEYVFHVPRTGWYELEVASSGAGVDYVIDSKSGNDPLHFYGGSGITANQDKIGNLWLEEGHHTLRMERYFWTGFPPISGFTLRSSTQALDKSLRVLLAKPQVSYRKNECPLLYIYSGDRSRDTTLYVWLRNPVTLKLLKTMTVPLPAGHGLTQQPLSLPCDEEGGFLATFGEAYHEILFRDVWPVFYEVINTSPRTAATGGEIAKILVQEIDCASTDPDYFDGGPARVVRKPLGAYRESGDTGWTRYQRLPETLRKIAPRPSWFAYTLKGLSKQQPYLVEVEYPDDALRTFAIALRESDPLAYPVAGGIDSGGEFSLSRAMQKHTLLFWPRSNDARIVFMTAHDGRRAAAARIRIYRIESELPPLAPPGGRGFVNWYEEGSNYQSMYGVPDGTPEGTRLGIERWASAVAYMGGNILSPTVSVYSFNLYPSRYNLAFSSAPGDDTLRRILLTAEKYGLKVLPELHPRADELIWPHGDHDDTQPNLMVSKEGTTSYFAQDGKTRNYPPYYNPIHPANQEWYIGMIGELADRYKDSAALMGISLRLMPWANPALNNFVSLDWGYDDYTVDLFQKETGAGLPAAIAGNSKLPLSVKAPIRYRWLMEHARNKWIAWRCKKIADLYERIRNRVRQARPDLKIYSTVFSWNDREKTAEAMREAGIDTGLLSRIDGVILINGLTTYGRREAEESINQTVRDKLLNPAQLRAFKTSRNGGMFLTSANYLEATEAVATNAALGFPAAKATWTSAAVNPAGRHFLERYAVQLAETDALWMGDGGNAYSLGQPELRDFLREYRALPAVSFSPRLDARDPAAVWELKRADGYFFYAVNRERFNVALKIHLNGSGKEVYRLADGQQVAVNNGALDLELAPYQLLAFRAATDTSIVEIKTVAPENEINTITAQANWLSRLDGEIQDKGILSFLSGDQRRLLHTHATEAEEALRRRQLWRARTLMEDHGLLQIYDNLRRRPPYLRDDSSE